MTVIAWDGKTIAADKRGVTAGLCITTTKLRRLNTGEILAWTGDQDSGEMVAAWYAAGGNPMEWPACQQKEETWSRLIIATKETVKYFERQPIAITVEDPFAAWGSGRDFAIAAMYLGKTAEESVKVACLFDYGSGNGIDVMVLEDSGMSEKDFK